MINFYHSRPSVMGAKTKIWQRGVLGTAHLVGFLHAESWVSTSRIITSALICVVPPNHEKKIVYPLSVGHHMSNKICFPLIHSHFEYFRRLGSLSSDKVPFPTCQKDDIDQLSLLDEKVWAFATKPKSKLASHRQTASWDAWHGVSTGICTMVYARRLWTITPI